MNTSDETLPIAARQLNAQECVPMRESLCAPSKVPDADGRLHAFDAELVAEERRGSEDGAHAAGAEGIVGVGLVAEVVPEDEEVAAVRDGGVALRRQRRDQPLQVALRVRDVPQPDLRRVRQRLRGGLLPLLRLLGCLQLRQRLRRGRLLHHPAS